MCYRLYFIAICLVAFPKVFSQVLYPTERPGIGSCPVLSDDSVVFGNRTAVSDQGLLPTLFIMNDGTSPLTLRILRVHLLCEAVGLYRNTASSASYLVEYEEQGVSTPQLAQVSVDCIADTFNSAVNYSFFPAPQPGSSQTIDLNTARNTLGTLITSQIVSNFSTESAFNCGRCGQQGGAFGNPFTRCVACNNCTQGMMRCLGRDENQCCSWFLNDRCVQFCPTPLVGNTETFDCGCPRLSIDRGTVSYSNNLLIGSVATYSCDETIGYILAPGSPTNRTCTMTGWTGDEATCELFDCKMTDLYSPQNGEFTLATGRTTFGSMATFNCNDKYQLCGVSTRTCGLNGWSDDNPTCYATNILSGPRPSNSTYEEGATNGLSSGIVVIIGVFSFVLGHVSGIIVGVCLMIVGYKLQTYGRSHSRNVPTDVIDMEISRTLPDDLLYEDINEVAITKPRESLQLQENIAYGKVICNP